jgi:hypothetical protein
VAQTADTKPLFMAANDAFDFLVYLVYLVYRFSGFPDWSSREAERCGRRHFMDLGANLLCM